MNGWIKRIPAAAVAVVLLPGLLAGCVGDDDLVSGPGVEYVDEPVEGLVIDHEEGSASYGAARFADSHVWRTCPAAGTTGGNICREVVQDQVRPATASSPPVDETDPAVDILGAKIHESSRDFMVTIEMAELREQWDHIGNNVYLDHRLQFTYDSENGTREGAIRLEVSNQNGVISFFPTFYYLDECNVLSVCWYRISYEIEYGQPGLIHLIVPRTLLPPSAQREQLTVTEVSVRHLSGPLFETRWSLDDGGQVDERGSLAVPSWHNFAIDRWTGEETFTFQSPRRVLEDGSEGKWPLITNQGNAFDPIGRYRPETDMLEISMEETNQTLTLSVQVASVREDPGDHFLWTLLGIPDGRGMEGGFSVADGEREAFSGYYSLPEWQWNDVPARLDVEPGEPGWLRLTWLRSDIGSPAKGDLLTLGFVMMYGNAFTDDWRQTHDVGPFGIETIDSSGGFRRAETLPAYKFQLDTTPPKERPLGIIIEDERGDVAPPRELAIPDTGMEQFDITGLKVEGRDESTIRASLGIEDLSRVEVPTGYEAVVYAVGLHTDVGKFMAFFYKDTDQQGYYCATDALVFDEPSDPRSVVWTPITGLQSHGSADPANGALVLNVPHECLGAEKGEPFEVQDFAAGTFLLEDPVGSAQLVQVHPMDEARVGQGEIPFLLGVENLPENEESRSTWYSSPLGLGGQGWDVMGVAIALLLSTGGAFMVYQRRRKLRRYLSRVSHAAKIKDLTARETGLGELREALRADLVAGRIVEGHYTIVLRHIEDAMKDVRVKSIEETFRELPFHVVSKLRAVLDDGVITQDEREMVVDLVARAEIADKDKQKVLSRLERWQLVDEVAKA